jgi:uncharacterized protein (TIGR02271 family)
MANANPHHESLWEKVKHAFGGTPGGTPTDFDQDEQYYRGQYDASIANRVGGAGAVGAGVAGAAGAAAGGASAPLSYDRARPAYRLGHEAGLHADASARSFEDVEPELQRGYGSHAGGNDRPAWADVRGHVADAFTRGRERRLVLSEEQLAVGKRRVAAGEVELRTTVETQQVREQVELRHNEVSVERRPLSAADASAAGNLEIREESIRVPLTREEAVVEKRVVPVEEVVVRTNEVVENQTVEDTVRRERLVTEGLEQQRGSTGAGLSGGAAGAAGASGASGGGLLDRAANKLDDLKDRVDGNPASRPGRDATDRR